MSWAGILIAALIIGFGTLATAAEPVQVIEVMPGDTLNELCGQYMRDPGLCREIAVYNKLKNPDRIEPGEKISIPVTYLKQQPLVGTVTFVKGDGLVQRVGAGPWVLLAAGDTVHTGDRVRTGPQSSVELAFDDGSNLRLRADTEMVVEVLVRQDRGFFKRVFLGFGRLLSKTVKQGVASHTEIATETAVAGIKGTRFDLLVLEDRTTQSVVQEGSITVSAMGKDVQVNAGEGTSVRKGMPPEEPRKVLAAPALIGLKDTYHALPVTVQYAAVEGAKAYRTVLTRDREGRDTIAETTVAPGAAFTAPDLENGTYYLQVRSIDSQGMEGMESEPATITVQIVPQPVAPPPPVPAPAPAVQPVPQAGQRGLLDAILGVIFVIAVVVM